MVPKLVFLLPKMTAPFVTAAGPRYAGINKWFFCGFYPARLTLIAFGAESDVNYKKGIVCMLTVKSLNKSYRVGKATCKVLKGDFL